MRSSRSSGRSTAPSRTCCACTRCTRGRSRTKRWRAWTPSSPRCAAASRREEVAPPPGRRPRRWPRACGGGREGVAARTQEARPRGQPRGPRGRGPSRGRVPSAHPPGPTRTHAHSPHDIVTDLSRRLAAMEQSEKARAAREAETEARLAWREGANRRRTRAPRPPRRSSGSAEGSSAAGHRARTRPGTRAWTACRPRGAAASAGKRQPSAPPRAQTRVASATRVAELEQRVAELAEISGRDLGESGVAFGRRNASRADANARPGGVSPRPTRRGRRASRSRRRLATCARAWRSLRLEHVDVGSAEWAHAAEAKAATAVARGTPWRRWSTRSPRRPPRGRPRGAQRRGHARRGGFASDACAARRGGGGGGHGARGDHFARHGARQVRGPRAAQPRHGRGGGRRGGDRARLRGGDARAVAGCRPRRKPRKRTWRRGSRPRRRRRATPRREAPRESLQKLLPATEIAPNPPPLPIASTPSTWKTRSSRSEVARGGPDARRRAGEIGGVRGVCDRDAPGTRSPRSRRGTARRRGSRRTRWARLCGDGWRRGGAPEARTAHAGPGGRARRARRGAGDEPARAASLEADTETAGAQRRSSPSARAARARRFGRAQGDGAPERLRGRGQDLGRGRPARCRAWRVRPRTPWTR